ncbi:heparan sulfate glucosamine 3-O-sulfotransferase 5-like [Lutzomyia longipalpis]|uniref:heparan sulfate glucosamine 3-O-sulfotransferase 5-like n=1 Tax=Lutzomyia longipalpis TaxID=7200 RepID=UPI002483507C|nr:heparan sulfate glucosamine 3-O-sulfotransferase 5-like [Lutzomyia longipalpis]
MCMGYGGCAARKKMQAIIIGVKKGGTRALLQMLSLHPHIQNAGNEIHFFDRNENYHKGLKWYRKRMPLSFPGQITIEKTPGYFVTPEVPERVRAMNASIKLLLIVREPVTRAISEYTQHLAKATLPQVKSTKTGGVAPSLQEYQTFEELALFPNGSINESYRPLVISMYDLHMHRWLEVFPREQMLIVNGDQLIDDPLPQLTKIETFLGIQHRIERKNFYFNTTKGFFCLRNDARDKCLRESKGRKHPHVDQAVVSKLRRFFSDHNQKFYELIGEDLGWPEE